MSAFNTKTFRMIGLLILILTLLAGNARAALPDAGTEIGTHAVVQYEIDGAAEQAESNRVTTTIAQVYVTKIEAVSGLVGKAGEEVDVRFSVRNIGNGTDDLKLSLSSKSGIPSFMLMPANDAGVADESSAVKTDMGKPFATGDMARDQVRHFAARVVLPKTATEAQEFVVKAIGAKGKETTETVVVKIVDGNAFTVEPLANVKLDENKSAIVEFKVKGGAEGGAGHFELIVAKKAEPKTPVKFTVQKNQIVFNGKNVAETAIGANGKAITFGIDDIAKNDNVDFKMNIMVDGAKRGDEYVMYVKYGRTKDASLTESPAMQIAYAHEMQLPTLFVTGNSAGSTGNFKVIPEAVSGQAVDYTLTLENESSRPESFSLELNQKDADAIANIWLIDEKGNKFGTASGSGLPETGLIPVGDSMTFKIKVELKHGITTALDDQQFDLYVRSLTDPKTGVVRERFSIEEIVPVEKPQVKFIAYGHNDKEATEVKVEGKDDVAKFYLHVATPDQIGKTLRDYEIRFDSPDTNFQRTNGGKIFGAEVAEMAVKVGNGKDAGRYLVKTQMRGKAQLTVTVAVTDVVTGHVEEKTITLKKDVSIGFAETSYSGEGKIDMDTILTVNVMNYGAAVNDKQYEIHAPENKDWGFLFSLNGETWTKELPLLAMATQATQAVQVKIRVPKSIKAGSIQALDLALRKAGETDNDATVVVTLTIGKAKLLINKEIAVLKAGIGSRNYAVKSNDQVEDGDIIWYRVVVKNPVDAPVAQNVKIIDLLPKHVKFAAAAGEKVKNVKNEVSMTVGEMQAGDEATMEYSVKVNLEK